MVKYAVTLQCEQIARKSISMYNELSIIDYAKSDMVIIGYKQPLI
jgi:hypothetical protein